MNQIILQLNNSKVNNQLKREIYKSQGQCLLKPQRVRSDSLSSSQSQNQNTQQEEKDSDSNLQVESNHTKRSNNLQKNHNKQANVLQNNACRINNTKINEKQQKTSQQNVNSEINDVNQIDIASQADQKPIKTNNALFQRIEKLVSNQNKQKISQLEDAQNYRQKLNKQEQTNLENVVNKSDFYCKVCQISFKTINYLQTHNNNFHKDSQNNNEIQFTCEACEVKSYNTKEGCKRHQERCLQHYVSIINSQEGEQVLQLKDFNQEEQSLINIASKYLRKKY